MTTQRVSGVGATSSSTPVQGKSGRKYPDAQALKKAAEQLGISVEQLKEHLTESKVPTNRKSIYGLVDNNKMDMKAFCILNGIDHSKWREYQAKADGSNCGYFPLYRFPRERLKSPLPKHQLRYGQ